MILPIVLLLLGASSLWLAIREFRELRNRDGNFSEWIVSDATKVNRGLWIANAWTEMVALFVAAGACLIGALWLVLAN